MIPPTLLPSGRVPESRGSRALSLCGSPEGHPNGEGGFHNPVGGFLALPGIDPAPLLNGRAS